MYKRQQLPQTDAPTRIVVDDLVAGFGEQEVIHRVSMGILDRQVTAIIGPSGCGKSTLLRCLNRMHELVRVAWVRGRVSLDDENIYDKRVDPVLLRRRIGMVFQKPNPFPNMSVRENVLAGLRLTGQLQREEVDQTVREALEKAALWDEVKDRLDQPGMSLSGGQQQRLCIARSLAVQPDILLMDEPCSALDPVATARIEDLIGALREHYTIVIVTHNMQQAARVSERTAFFNIDGTGQPGHIIEMDLTETMFSNPKEQATSDYVTGRFG